MSSNNDRKVQLWNEIRFFLFICSVVAILWMTVLNREPHTHQADLRLFWSFRELMSGDPEGAKDFIQYLDNILLFIPFGFFFPWKNRWWYSVLIAAIFSATIEVCQYFFALGLAELDDVISNTLGALTGYMICKFVKFLSQNYKSQQM